MHQQYTSIAYATAVVTLKYFAQKQTIDLEKIMVILELHCHRVVLFLLDQ